MQRRSSAGSGILDRSKLGDKVYTSPLAQPSTLGHTHASKPARKEAPEAVLDVPAVPATTSATGGSSYSNHHYIILNVEPFTSIASQEGPEGRCSTVPARVLHAWR